MGAIGPTQVILIVLVVLLLFGGRKIPELMRGLGRGVKEFKDATQDDGKAGDDADKADGRIRRQGWRALGLAFAFHGLSTASAQETP